MKTVDGGSTWSRETTLIRSTLRSLSILDAGTVFAAGDYGVVLRSPANASAIFAPDKAVVFRSQAGSGRLRLALPGAVRVSGRLYGLDGRALSRLEFGVLPAGIHSLAMPALPAGAYILDLRQGSSRTKLFIREL